MTGIEEHSLYIASWEHLYLLPNGVPAGLPNQLFSRHPWALILFENLYCDENGFKGEQNAADMMKWTNSELFVRLASSKYDIIKPLNLKHPLQLFVSSIKSDFKGKHHISVEEAINTETVSVDELFEWRLKLLNPFLTEHRLVLYDWPLAQYGLAIPPALKIAVKDVLMLETAPVPLSKDVNAELSPERKKIFDDLQIFESEPLRHLRSGRLPQLEYLDILKKRIKDYREVDMELVKDIDTNLDRILRLRERFGKRGGWKLVRDFLKEYEQNAEAKKLNEIDEALRDKLNYCFKPLWTEYGRATFSITKGIVSLLPKIGGAITATEMIGPAKKLLGLASENVNFFRGQIRRGKK